MEIKISSIWKERIVYWCRDLILVFGMWCVWLTRVYMTDVLHANIITAFLIVIIVITILLGEYYRVTDYTVRSLEQELEEIKKR